MIEHLSEKIVEQLWYASVLCVMKERHHVALEAMSVAL